MGAAFSYVNHLDDAATVLAASDQSASLPVGNLQDWRIAKVWRSGASIAAFFTADLGSVKAIDAVGLFGLQIGATDTVRIRLSTVALGASDVFDTTALASGIVAGYNQYLWLPGSTKNARYLKVDINAASLAAQGYFDLARCWVGALWSPAYNFKSGAEFLIKDPSANARAVRSSIRFSDRFSKYRTANFTFGALSATEAAKADDMDLTVGTTQQFLFVRDKAGDLARQPILGTQTQVNPTVWAAPLTYTKQYQLEEDR